MNKKFPLIALIGLSIANFMGCLDLTIVNTALPAIKTSLHLVNSELQWVINVVLLALTAFMVVVGKLADRYGRRLVLYLAMLLFASSSFFAGMADNLSILLVSRFFQGLSIAVLYTAPVALVSEIYSAKAGKYLGILFGASGFGLAIGPALGGVITSTIGWHAIFLINIPIILVSFTLCYISLPESKSLTNENIDFIGSLLVVITLILVVYTVVNASHAEWYKFKTLLFFMTIIVLLAFFVKRENRIKYPIINFKLFLNRTFIVGLSANFFLALFYSINLFFIPLYLHTTGNLTNDKIGLILLTPTIMVALLSPISGTLSDKFGARNILIFGYFFLVISSVLQIIFIKSDYIFLNIIPYLLFGTGWALILSPSIARALSSLPREVGGVAMGTIGTWHNFGGAIGLAIGSVLGYLCAMWVVLTTSILSLIIIYFGDKKTT